MAFVRIDLIRGHRPDQVRAIADETHRALVEVLDIPERDRFQIVTEHDADDVSTLDTGLGFGFERTDQAVMIQIFTQSGCPIAVRQRVFRAITERLKRLGISGEDVFIGIVEVGPCLPGLLVPDELWALFRRVVPERVVMRRQGGGRRRAGDRECLAAIVFVATTGCTWRQLPPVFGPAWPTVYRRFAHWSQARVWARLHKVILDELGADDEVGVAGKLEWSRRAIDSVSVRALDAGHWRERDQPAAAGTDRRSI